MRKCRRKTRVKNDPWLGKGLLCSVYVKCGENIVPNLKQNVNAEGKV